MLFSNRIHSMRGKKKLIKPVVDGINSKDPARLRSAVRRVWQWYSEPRKIAISRCRVARGLYRCERCHTIDTVIQVDHIEPCGDVFSNGYLTRLYCSSQGLQGLCEKCHKEKTAYDRKLIKAHLKID